MRNTFKHVQHPVKMLIKASLRFSQKSKLKKNKLANAGMDVEKGKHSLLSALQANEMSTNQCVGSSEKLPHIHQYHLGISAKVCVLL